MSATVTPAPAAAGLHGIALLCTAVLIFAAMDTLAKYLGQFYPVPALVWARYAVHLAAMVVLLGPRRRFRLLRTRRLGLQVLRAVLLLGSTFLFFHALRHLPLAEATAIGFTAPLLVTALSVPLLGETVGVRRWAAVVVGFLGVLVIIRPGSGLLTPAVALPLGMALCFGLYQILTRKLSTSEDPVTTLFYTALVGTAVATSALPFNWVVPGALHGVLIVALGSLGAIGHFLLIRAFTLAPASLLAPFFYSQIAWAVLLGLAVFGTLPDLVSLGGMAVIVASGLYVAYRENLRRRQRQQAAC